MLHSNTKYLCTKYLYIYIMYMYFLLENNAASWPEYHLRCKVRTQQLKCPELVISLYHSAS